MCESTKNSTRMPLGGIDVNRRPTLIGKSTESGRSPSFSINEKAGKRKPDELVDGDIENENERGTPNKKRKIEIRDLDVPIVKVTDPAGSEEPEKESEEIGIEDGVAFRLVSALLLFRYCRSMYE